MTVNFMISFGFDSSFKTLSGSGYTWWSGNARFIQLSGKFLGAHLAHGSLMLLWAGSMGFFEISHLLIEKPLYEQGMIVIPHMANLGLGVGPGGELSNVYPFLVISSVYLVSSAIIALGGIYHSLFGIESLEDSQKSYLFSFSWTDRTRVSSILGVHLVIIGIGSLALVAKGLFLGGIYDSWAAGGGDVRMIRYSSLTLNFIILGRYLLRAPFGGQGSIVSVNNLEDLLGGHVYLGFGCILGGFWYILTSPLGVFVRGFSWSDEAYLSYSLSAVSLSGFAASIYSWYNNTAYPSEIYGPTGPEASQSQGLTFLIHDVKLGVFILKSQGPTSLGKYLMRSPSGEIILGGETMRFWSVQGSWLEPLRSSRGLDVQKIQINIQTWQERRSAEYMTHAPLGSLNSVGGVATEINSLNFVSPRSWLTCSHWVLAYFMLVGHWWHAGRARSAVLLSIRGITRVYETVLYMRPID